MCGLKQMVCTRYSWRFSHTLRGCVDWNPGCRSLQIHTAGHTLRGCVDWNINGYRKDSTRIESHPSWVCGLKLECPANVDKPGWSHPSWVCGLKQLRLISVPSSLGHTLRGCVDWNLTCAICSIAATKSHPSWVCGLNLVTCLLHLVQIGAPA